MIKKHALTGNPYEFDEALYFCPLGTTLNDINRDISKFDADWQQRKYNNLQTCNRKGSYRKYNDAFFKDHALAVIFTSESSGSNYYTGVKINSDKNEIYINRYIPEVRTADMASWAIICEVSANDPILTKDNTKTQVIKTEW